MILAIAVAFVASSIITGTVVTAQNDIIIACVNNKSQGKDLRIVDSADDCRNNETPLEWDKQGPKGDTGSQGTKGDKGDKGDTGSQGTKGDTGSQGTKGDKGDKGDTGTGGGGSIGKLDTTIITATCTAFTNIPCLATASCPSDRKLTGGYATFSGNVISLPIDHGPIGDTWQAQVQSSPSGGTSATVIAKAICGKVTP